MYFTILQIPPFIIMIMVVVGSWNWNALLSSKLKVNQLILFYLLFPKQFKLNMSVMEGLMDAAFSELCVDPIAYTVMLIVPFNLGAKLTVSTSHYLKIESVIYQLL